MVSQLFSKIKINSGLMWSFSNSFIVSLFGFLSYSLLSKNLSVIDYSFFSILLSVLGVFISIGTFGMHIISSKLYEKNEHHSHISKLFQLSLFTVVLALILFFVTAKIMRLSIFDNELYKILIIFIPCSIYLRIISDLFRAKQRFNLFFLLNSIGSGAGIIFWIFSLALLFILVQINYLNIYNIFLSLTVASLISFFLFLTLYYSQIVSFLKKFIFKYEKLNFKLFFSSTFFVFITVLLRTIKENFSIIILWFVGSQTDSGIFFNIYRSLFIVFIPIIIIDNIIPQFISDYFKNNFQKLKAFSRKISTYRIIASLVLFLPLYIFAEQYLEFFFGLQYAEGYQSLRFLISCFIISQIFGISYSILLLTKYEKQLALIDFILLTIFILFSIYFSSIYGYKAAIICFSLLMVVSSIVYYIFCLNIIGINVMISFSPKKIISYIKKDLFQNNIIK